MKAVPEVVGPAITDYAARRLARATFTLVATGLLALGEWIASGLADPVSFVVLLGVPASAAGLVGLGYRGVQQGFGRMPAGVLRLAGLLGVIPLLHGLWVFGISGLRRVADGGPGAGRWVLAAVYVYLGLRLLRDTLRVHEVGRLAHTMLHPAPEEG
jgi:hypothetical protein